MSMWYRNSGSPPIIAQRACPKVVPYLWSKTPILQGVTNPAGMWTK